MLVASSPTEASKHKALTYKMDTAARREGLIEFPGPVSPGDHVTKCIVRRQTRFFRGKNIGAGCKVIEKSGFATSGGKKTTFISRVCGFTKKTKKQKCSFNNQQRPISKSLVGYLY